MIAERYGCGATRNSAMNASLTDTHAANDSMPSGWGRSVLDHRQTAAVADEEVSPNVRKPCVHAPARGKAVIHKELTRRKVCRDGQR